MVANAFSAGGLRDVADTDVQGFLESASAENGQKPTSTVTGTVSSAWSSTGTW